MTTKTTIDPFEYSFWDFLLAAIGILTLVTMFILFSVAVTYYELFHG